MGEYADMAVDAGLDEYWQRDQDGEDDSSGMIGGSFRTRRTLSLKTCARCGKTGLFWQNTENGWRLHDFATNDDSVLGTPVAHICGQKAES